MTAEVFATAYGGARELALPSYEPASGMSELDV
jgi:hypothetical protein